MRATHFGAGNIGRGFIGEILFNNGFAIDFVDINATIIDALKERQAYEIELASAAKERIAVNKVNGLNNQTEPEAVIDSVAAADVVTTAIGPNILPFIAELIAKGIQKRRAAGNETPLDVIACENMIGGSAFLFSKVREYLTAEDLAYVDQYVGFPMPQWTGSCRFSNTKIHCLFRWNHSVSGWSMKRKAKIKLSA